MYHAATMTRATNTIRLFAILILASFAIGCSSSGSDKSKSATSKNTFDVRRHGAVGDGTSDDTRAFQDALTLCAERGGGEVAVPAGNYLIGSVVMGSKTTLRFEQGAKITGKPLAEAYPLRKIRWEGRWREGHQALIHAENAHDIAIVGPGVINGATPMGYLRRPRGPCIIEFIECSGVRLDSFSINYERMWAVHPTFCSDVTIKGLTIRSKRPNGDGIDVDSCKDVRITACDIDAGDDAIALKSGRGQEAVAIASPTENVYIADCKLGSDFAGLAIGTEMSGGVRNVKFERCTFTRGSNSIFIKSRIGRGGFLENIEGRDIEAKASAFLRIDLLTKGIQDEQPVEGVAGIPVARNLRFENVTASVPFLVDGALVPPEKPLDGLSLINIKGTARKGIELANMRNVELREIDVKVEQPPLLRISNVTGTGIEGASPLPPRRPATTRSAASTAPAGAAQP